MRQPQRQYAGRPLTIDYLRSVLAALDDDLSLPWGNYPCLIWPYSKISGGYGQGSEKGMDFLAHRLAYELTFGALLPGFFTCHRCDVRACFRPIHLFAGTAMDNVHDMIAKGRSRMCEPRPSRCGEGNHKAVLTEPVVKEIRSLRGVVTQSQLAERYGVSKSAIKHIHHGRSWGHV